jgi:hypothetical protein
VEAHRITLSLALPKLTTPFIPVLRAHFKNYAISKHPYFLGILSLNIPAKKILALNILTTPKNSSLLSSFTLHAPMHGYE